MQPEKELEKGRKHCFGIVREKRRGDKVTYTLRCSGDCEKGKCEIRTETDHHGTTTTWCSCDDSPGGCNIYISKDARGVERIDCFTLGCGDGTECRPVKIAEATSDGVTLIDWQCACVKIK